jgi:hypothetical protein
MKSIYHCPVGIYRLRSRDSQRGGRKTQDSTQQIRFRVLRGESARFTGRRGWPIWPAEMTPPGTGWITPPQSFPPSQGGDTGSNPVGTAHRNRWSRAHWWHRRQRPLATSSVSDGGSSGDRCGQGSAGQLPTGKCGLDDGSDAADPDRPGPVGGNGQSRAAVLGRGDGRQRRREPLACGEDPHAATASWASSRLFHQRTVASAARSSGVDAMPNVVEKTDESMTNARSNW